MAYKKQQLRYTWQWVIDGLEEIAETSLHTTTLLNAPYDAAAALGALTTTQMQACLANMNTLISGNSNPVWASYSKLVSLKVAALDTAGHYITDPKVWDSTSTYKGTSTSSVPPQCSVVLSLRSGSNIGVANYGRMFLPHMYWATITASPYAPQADINAFAAKAKTFINSITTISNTLVAGSGVDLMSFKDGSDPKAVTKVGLWPLTETQRRRMHQIPATYTFATL